MRLDRTRCCCQFWMLSITKPRAEPQCCPVLVGPTCRAQTQARQQGRLMRCRQHVVHTGRHMTSHEMLAVWIAALELPGPWRIIPPSPWGQYV